MNKLLIKGCNIVEKIKPSKKQIPAFAALFIVFACYTAEKIFKNLTVWSNTSAIIQAMVYVVCTVVVYFLLIKTKDIYLGIISAIYAFKLLPPNLSMLEYINKDANIIYFIADKAAIALFTLVIYRFYKSQGEQKEIKAAPILALLLATPFFNTVSEELIVYTFDKTGSMMLPYAVQAVCYIASMIILMVIVCISSGKSSSIIIDFSIIGLIVNILRRVSLVVVFASYGNHISKSYFCWIAIYIVLIICFVILRKKKIKG